MLLQVDEVTMITVASATQAIATQSSAELELGAHVAGIRSIVLRAPAASRHPRPFTSV